MERLPLARPRDDRVVAGVCAGLATHLGVSARAARIGAVVLTGFGGFGALLYVWLWATVPEVGETEGIVPLRRALTRPAVGSEAAASRADRAASSAEGAGLAAGTGGLRGGRANIETRPTGPARPAAGNRETGAGAGVQTGRGADAGFGEGTTSAPTPGDARGRFRGWPIAELLLGACLLIVGIGLVFDRFGARVNLEVLLPALAVLVGVGLTWWQIADRNRPDRNQMPRVLGALALVAVGVLMFFVTSREPSMWTVIAAALAVLAGVALAIAPWLLRINRELIAERAARAREAERSDIAAHLHDSVLQTLAMIQQRSDPGSEVARIARGQERELRDWLFRVADGGYLPPREAVDTELRAHATALENEHAVRFELVTAGIGDGLIAPDPIVAAAREAMLNAARHAGGDVTVFIEASRDRVSIDVADRGPGLDLGALPEGRMGVRESILGRMERAGGTAMIVPGPGGGTSVRLAVPRGQAGETTGEANGERAGRND